LVCAKEQTVGVKSVQLAVRKDAVIGILDHSSDLVSEGDGTNSEGGIGICRCPSGKETLVREKAGSKNCEEIACKGGAKIWCLGKTQFEHLATSPYQHREVSCDSHKNDGPRIFFGVYSNVEVSVTKVDTEYGDYALKGMYVGPSDVGSIVATHQNPAKFDKIIWKTSSSLRPAQITTAKIYRKELEQLDNSDKILGSYAISEYSDSF
jgi:hypothetical protein